MPIDKPKKNICFIVAVLGTARAFLKNHIEELSKIYDIYLVGNIDESEDLSDFRVAEYKSIKICRKISLISDIKAIVELCKYFRQNKFDAVHSVTPKAGLLTAVASKIVGIKHRIHIFTGQIWVCRKGLMKILLKYSDKLIFKLNNHIIVDGESQRQFLIKNKIISDSKSKVLGNGSISGVDIDKFTPIPAIRKEIRNELNISDNTIVYSYLGRLNRDKGIHELFLAFNELIKECPQSYLLIIGTDEENCINTISKYPNIKDGINFKFYGRSDYPNITLQASDVFCMPSYREGFGTSVIEAQSLAIPVICTDIYGLSDAFIDSETGLKCQSKNWESLFLSMKYFYDNTSKRLQYGINGRKRVSEFFSNKLVTYEWVKYYKSVLGD